MAIGPHAHAHLIVIVVSMMRVLKKKLATSGAIPTINPSKSS
jgi:hypothetical protein